MIGLCIYCFEKEKTMELGICCALLLLTRSEGVFLILAMGIEHIRQRRPFPKPAAFILPILILAGNYLFNLLYYGTLFPHSSATKLYHGMSELWGTWPTAFLKVRYQFNIFFFSDHILLFGVAGLALCGVLSLGKKSLNVICFLFVCFLTCFYVFFNIPSYHWYYAPYYVLAYFYAGAGAAWLARQFRAVPNRWIYAMGTLSVYGLMLFLVCRNFVLTDKKNGMLGRRADYYDIATWIKENTPAMAQLAAAEIGTLGWYSERPIVDLCGLVSPAIAEAYRDRDFESFYPSYSPEYVLVHDPMFPLERGITGFVKRGDYILKKRFDFSPSGSFILYVKSGIESRPKEL